MKNRFEGHPDIKRSNDRSTLFLNALGEFVVQLEPLVCDLTPPERKSFVCWARASLNYGIEEFGKTLFNSKDFSILKKEILKLKKEVALTDKNRKNIQLIPKKFTRLFPRCHQGQFHNLLDEVEKNFSDLQSNLKKVEHLMVRQMKLVRQGPQPYFLPKGHISVWLSHMKKKVGNKSYKIKSIKFDKRIASWHSFKFNCPRRVAG